MKRYLLFTGMLLVFSNFLMAQTRPYNVVFDLTSGDTIDHKMVINWVHEIVDNNPKAKVEVVLYAKSLDMITQGKSVVGHEVAELAKNKNVAFRVCAIAMKKNHVDNSQLIAGVEPVPDGIYEVISKQSEGYGYIKATR